jgi:hypothetical protein
MSDVDLEEWLVMYERDVAEDGIVLSTYAECDFHEGIPVNVITDAEPSHVLQCLLWHSPEPLVLDGFRKKEMVLSEEDRQRLSSY